MKINLKKIREEKNISQSKLAILAGISRSYVSEIEAGKKTPSLDMLEKIAEALEVCTTFLLINNRNCCNCARHKNIEDLTLDQAEKIAHELNICIIDIICCYCPHKNCIGNDQFCKSKKL
ncbi:helix-turn-helix transcriptional regulator [Clostridium niameyense]|uniref:Helix-turn-helix transcriptional regulator n=1 Tax=Clostridium niameyense TaxID=1622073 RepID=A0A6M0RBS3_9CLOT|nr:helix-turn-helix transcriptional regulator [Clostridium niameyense]